MRMLAMRLACLMALASSPSAHAQKATELFIPIGQSPGVSGAHSWIGEIVGTDAEQRTLTLRVDGSEKAVRLTDATRVYLDRSKLKQPNRTGGFADLVPGREVEVKYEGTRGGPGVESPPPLPGAEWVKVAIGQP